MTQVPSVCVCGQGLRNRHDTQRPQPPPQTTDVNNSERERVTRTLVRPPRIRVFFFSRSISSHTLSYRVSFARHPRPHCAPSSRHRSRSFIKRPRNDCENDEYTGKKKKKGKNVYLRRFFSTAYFSWSRDAMATGKHLFSPHCPVESLSSGPDRRLRV